MHSKQTTLRHNELAQGFIQAIDDFEQGAYSSRGLARRVEQLTTSDELNSLDDELLSHTFWVSRHLLHQPACWAPTHAELQYLYNCLTGEEVFAQEIAEGFRQ